MCEDLELSVCCAIANKLLETQGHSTEMSEKRSALIDAIMDWRKKYHHSNASYMLLSENNVFSSLVSQEELPLLASLWLKVEPPSEGQSIINLYVFGTNQMLLTAAIPAASLKAAVEHAKLSVYQFLVNYRLYRANTRIIIDNR